MTTTTTTWARPALVILSAGWLLLACDESTEPPDGGPADAAGAVDARVELDAAPPMDAAREDGGRDDAGADASLGGADAGGAGDAAGIDAGTGDGDAATSMDAATGMDAAMGADASAEIDAGAAALDGAFDCVVPTTHATIAAAVADLGCPTIVVLPGAYAERLMISRSVVIQGDAASAVVIDGSDGGTVIRVGASATVRLSGLTLRGGRALPGEAGGGVVNLGDLTLEDCVVRDNEAPSGAGIATSGTLTLRRTRVEENVIDPLVAPLGARGAGILVLGGTVSVLDGSAVDDNEIIGAGGLARGGGIALEAASTLIVDDSSVSDNDVSIAASGPLATGGGISARLGSVVVIRNGAVVAGNVARASETSDSSQAFAWGGGVYVQGSTLDVTDSTLRENTIEGTGTLPPFLAGGGIGADDSTVTVTDTTIADNDVTFLGSEVGTATGGGVYFQGDTTGPRLALVRSTLSGNVCTAGLQEGGALGIEYRDEDVEIVVDQCTLSGNSARHGGGIYAYATGGNEAHVYVSSSTITSNVGNQFFDYDGAGGIEPSNNVVIHLRGSIVYGNTGNSLDCFTGPGAEIDSVGYNVLGDVSECDVLGAQTGDQVGADPALAALADNGGPTLTHAIGASAAAHETGDPGGCADADGVPFTIDQRGLPRPVARCDVGAVELAP